MEGRLPDFLVPGAQKGGTTTLQALLSAHQQVFLPAGKEVHYFSLHYERGAHWYGEQFADAVPSQCCGEITPYYLFHPEAPRRIQELLPGVRLVLLLRDPVERAVSQYFHSVRLGLEPLSLEQALLAEPERLAGAEAVLDTPGGRHRSHQEHSYLGRSRYEQQLERYLRLFRREQLLILRSEDLFVEPGRIWQRLLAFLDLEFQPLPSGGIRANAGRGEASGVPLTVRRLLRHHLEPTYQAMASHYGIVW
ncbi:sulfotransferase domain-containing protein [Synechococcus sp. BSF8S]|uniref:sulfotransferase domain-containing protein n=1 Tax=Synechococcales TaxID=1890424 RepID=UPI001624A07B|nr:MULTISPECIES: sulfotransferase domain-containing protein [unclassified Synechococcus]MBC1262451.1 sulfotransferase domain-containing protein [Synechococcus sp. BSF8S]MBC1265334.1 sulfotransferase domain-containing protein [Synechococcus sp. BSA11S]